jgi:hypothetical protein
VGCPPAACAGQDLGVADVAVFDGVALETGENQLVGHARTDLQHFINFAQRHGTVAGATSADAGIVKR